MKKEEIFLSDWKRILFGDAPFEFLIEVFIRTTLVYLALIMVARLLGKRMSGQLTLTETAVMVTLGAIVSPAMQLPDRGIAMGILALICALAFQRGLNLWGIKNAKFEKISQGSSTMLVKDGTMILEEMKNTRLSKQELFAALRGKNIYNLGKVERVYLEGCGLISIFLRTEEKPGLSLLPTRDEALCKAHQSAETGMWACSNCGRTIPLNDGGQGCPACGKKDYSSAVLNL